MLLDCPHCQATVDASQVADYDLVDQPSGEPYHIAFLRCPVCNGPFLTAQLGYEDEEPYRMYPPSARRLGRAVPDPLRESFEEAQDCFQVKAYTAATVMVGRTLEGLCDHFGVREGVLAKSLIKLRDTGVIDERLYMWADQLRLIRNEAAHDVKVWMSKEDAQDSLDFTEAILEYVFTFQARFDEFQQRQVAPRRRTRSGDPTLRLSGS